MPSESFQHDFDMSPATADFLRENYLNHSHSYSISLGNNPHLIKKQYILCEKLEDSMIRVSWKQ